MAVSFENSVYKPYRFLFGTKTRSIEPKYIGQTSEKTVDEKIK